MAVLDKEIAAYDGMRDYLEANHFGQWTVIHDDELVGTYDDFQEAAQEAVSRFGRGPYLIRQVGAGPITLSIPHPLQARPCQPLAPGSPTLRGFSVETRWRGKGQPCTCRLASTPLYRPQSGKRPALPDVRLSALVDTGALDSCIDSDLAAQLGLPIVDGIEVAGVLGAGEVNVHLAQIYVPALTLTIYGQFAGVHLTAGGLSHAAILGRSFLRRYVMNYAGPTGAVTISND